MPATRPDRDAEKGINAAFNPDYVPPVDVKASSRKPKVKPRRTGKVLF